MIDHLPIICFCISILLSLWHLTEEYKGKLWRYFGAIAGVLIPDWVGKTIFTVLLGVGLIVAALGILGINGEYACLSLGGVGFLIGARVSDWWSSHYRLKSKGYIGQRCFQKNPGLLSSWFYLADAALLIYFLWYFKKDIFSDSCLPFGISGFISGVLVFVLVFPILSTIRWIGEKYFPDIVKPRWKPNDKLPKWVKCD